MNVLGKAMGSCCCSSMGSMGGAMGISSGISGLASGIGSGISSALGSFGADASHISGDSSEAFSANSLTSALGGNFGKNTSGFMNFLSGALGSMGFDCSSADSAFGRISNYSQMFGAMNSVLGSMMESEMQELLALLQEMSENGGSSGAGCGYGGFGGGCGSVGNGCGSVGSTGSTSGYSPTQSGNSIAALAEKYLGRDSASCKGDLPHFTAAGGRNNNCADFVSSLLETNGMIGKHCINVRNLESTLKSAGYHQVSASQAQPGDVWMANDRSHTEIVEKAGNPPTLIGSNNNGDSIQEITRATKSSGVFYHKG